MKINLDKKQIRTFGLALAAILLTVGLWKFYKGQTMPSYIFLISGLISGISALFCQPLIKPIYIVMMKVAHILGWINTRILLGLIFYFLITPIGLLMKIFGKDVLDKKIESDNEDYWIKKEKKTFDRNSYENQY